MLEVTGLASAYGRITALRGVDLAVGAGEIVALVGSNGAGKTTLLKTIAGVQPASAGRITFLGREITGAPAHRRVAAGLLLVPEGRQVFAPLAVADNLRLGAYRRADRGEAAADLEFVHEMFPVLRERARQPAGSLSGGEQQMLAIGRALMGRPKLLLLDEPSMGLAPLLVAQIFAAVTRLREAGVTILLVEQNAAAALSVADRGYIMETGTIIKAGRGQVLLDDKAVQEAYLGV